jgi:hypothetical membrane protein
LGVDYLKRVKAAAIAGFVAPSLVFSFILVAIASWSQFNWINNALSDLGVVSGITATIFNIGLIVGGLIFLIFAAGLFKFVGVHWIGKVGVVIFGLACIMLILIGVFNESFSPTHYLVSVGLFTLMPISMLVLVAALWIQGRHMLSLFTLTLSLFAAAVWVLELAVQYTSGVAIPEFVSGLAGAFWVIVMSNLMLKESSKLSS